jgi:hypothetical protein
MKMRGVLLGLASIGIISACDDDDPTGLDNEVVYSAFLNGAGERPPLSGVTGTGSFTGTLSANNVLTYSVTWSGLTGASNNGHIHGPVPPGSIAAHGVLIDFNAPTAGRTITHGASGSATGTIDFKVAFNANISGDSLKKLFDNAAVYVNIHTAANPGGEIAGVISRQP